LFDGWWSNGWERAIRMWLGLMTWHIVNIFPFLFFWNLLFFIIHYLRWVFLFFLIIVIILTWIMALLH
jgi:hypothetical protein